MVIFKRHAHSLGNRVKLVPVKLRQERSCKSHRIDDRVLLVHTHNLFRFRLYKSGVKISIVCDKHCPLAKIYESRQYCLYSLRVNNHGIIYPGELLNSERYRYLRVDKTRKAVDTSPVLVLHGTDFYNSVILRGKSGCLKVEHDVCIIEGLSGRLFNKCL